MNTKEFVENTVQRTLSKYDERFSRVGKTGSYDDLSDKPNIKTYSGENGIEIRVDKTDPYRDDYVFSLNNIYLTNPRSEDDRTDITYRSVSVSSGGKGATTIYSNGINVEMEGGTPLFIGLGDNGNEITGLANTGWGDSYAIVNNRAATEGQLNVVDQRVIAVEEALNLTALTDQEIAALIPA